MSVSKEEFDQLVKRVENIEKHLHMGSTKSTGSEGSPAFEIPTWYTQHKQLVNEKLTPFIELSKKIAPEAEFVKLAYQDWVNEFLIMAAHCKRPEGNTDVQPVTQKGIKIFNDTDAYKDRASPYINYMNVASEIIRGASWPPMNPHETVQAMYEAGDFWMNKIRREGRNNNNTVLKDWCDSLKTFFDELIQFVKSNFKNGLEWNENGVTVKEYLSNPDYHHDKPSISTVAKPVETKPVETKPVETKPVEVTPPPVKSTPPPSLPKSTPAAATTAVNGVPKCDLDTNRNRWNVEYQTSDPNIKIGSMKEEVYLYHCKDTTIHINGKCKDIITENCENIHVVFEKVVSGVEIVHCKKIKLEVLSFIPSISVDKTDKYDLYLNEDSLACNIVVSHSTEGNVHYPYNGENSVQPIPEQYVYNIRGNELQSTVSELYTK